MKAVRYQIFRVGRDRVHHLGELFATAAGSVRLEEGSEMPLDAFLQALRAGQYTIELHPDTWVVFPLLGTVHVSEVEGWRITSDEFAKELTDAVSYVGGNETSLDRCNAALRKLLSTGTEEDQAGLRLAFEAVPAHLRRFLLGDMDRRDRPIVQLIESQNVHAAVASARVDPLLERLMEPRTHHRPNASIAWRVVDT
jgi:hypothetical protein